MPYMSKRNTTSDGVVPIGSNLFGTCSTAGSTGAKVVTMPSFNVLVEGVTIHVYFANGNTAPLPTLQVGSTAAKAVICNGSQGGIWKSGSFVSFTYYGGEWVQNDVQDGKTYGLSLSGNTLSIVENGGSSSVTINDDDTTYTLSINGHTLTLTPSSGTAQSVTVPDDNTTYTISFANNTLTLTGSDGSTSTATITVTPLKYTKDAPNVGTKTNNVVQNDVTNNVADGGYALAEGFHTTASGQESHAEGSNTTASHSSSHAEGGGTTSSGIASHSEGYGTTASGNYGSHAEGYDTTASGEASHAEGYNSSASGQYSHASGSNTDAQRRSQTVIGEYNRLDTAGDDETKRGDSAFIIGNGWNNGAITVRQNAYRVDWGGNSHHMFGYSGGVPNQDLGANMYIRADDGNSESWTGRFGTTVYHASSGVRDAGAVGAVMGARHPSQPNIANYIIAIVNPDGTREYQVSDPARFRAAIGIPDAVTSSGSGTASNATWHWRKWASGKIEAWCSYAPTSATSTSVLVSPIRYKDLTISIPSGVFSAAPARVYATSYNNQIWVVHAIGASATSITCRIATLSSSNITPSVRFYCFTP